MARPDWKHHVAMQPSTGLSIVEYCREHGLSKESFYYYRRKAPSNTTDQAFVPVKVKAELPVFDVRVSRTKTGSIKLEVQCDGLSSLNGILKGLGL